MLAQKIRRGKSLPEAREGVKRSLERSAKRSAQRDKSEAYTIFIKRFARALDPHSTYWTPLEYEDLKTSMELSLVGIGIQIESIDGHTVITDVVKGSPAARGRALPGQ